MRVAFYAPMKPASSPVPSGDRRMARALIAALESRGHEVRVASEYVSYIAAPDPMVVRTRCAEGYEMAQGLVRSCLAKSPDERPDLWFTYHVYYKAPDWLGPIVASGLGIPYVVAEASFAPKHAGGPWEINLIGVEASIRRADLLFGLNSADTACVLPFLKSADRLVSLKPFVKPFLPPTPAAMRQRTGEPVRLLTVAMMRAGAKLESYRILAEALGRLPQAGWHLTIAGDGPAEAEVRKLFAGLDVTFAGRADENRLAELHAEADLFVWPAVNEAYGMAILEAQQAGVPVVAGSSGGVGDIVADGETGLLVRAGDPAAFCEAVAALMADPQRRRIMAEAAVQKAAEAHGFAAAADLIDKKLRALVP
jgi:glycosyltransferase involved in cell wall biosynthesis